jgi:hypothetical protein
MGAVTVAIKKRTGYGAVGKMVVADVTFSSSYGAGGDTFTPSQFGLNTVDAILDCGTAGSATTSYNLLPDLANNKLRLIGGAASGVGGAETGTAGQTGTVAHVIVFGDNIFV